MKVRRERKREELKERGITKKKEMQKKGAKGDFGDHDSCCKWVGCQRARLK